MAYEASVAVVVRSNVTVSSPGSSFDGITLSANPTRILLTGQTAPIENGVWLWHTGATALTRPGSPDQYASANILDNAVIIPVTNGNTYAGTVWGVDPAAVIKVGTTAHTLTQVALPPVQARAASTANINLASTTTTLDGVSLVGNGLAGSDIILLKDQTNGSENGLYWANTGGALTSARTSEPLPPSRMVLISEGTTNPHTEWLLTNQRAVIVGTTALTFVQFKPASSVAIVKTVDGASAALTAGVAVVTKGANVTLATLTALAGVGEIAGVAITAGIPGGRTTVVAAGPVDTAVLSLGAGTACAVGLNSSGFPVRATDPSCVTFPFWLGTCDATGAITVAPRRADNLNLIDFGADSSGATYCDTAISAALAVAATTGFCLFVPHGLFKYRNTIVLPACVSIQGIPGSSQTYQHGQAWVGSTLIYDGLADGIRFASLGPDTNAGTYSTLRDFGIYCSNINNRAPTRLLPTQVVGGGVASVVAGAGNVCQVGTTTSHGLLTGQLVWIKGVNGVPGANNVATTCTVIDSTHFTLDGSVFSGSYTGGGVVTYACGAAIVALGSSGECRNVVIGSFCVGIILDGAEDFNIYNCELGNLSPFAGSDLAHRFSCGVWMTVGDAGARGNIIGQATGKNLIQDCQFSGPRIGIWAQGDYSSLIQNNESNVSNAQLDLGQFWCQILVAGTANNGSGKIRVTTTAPSNCITGECIGVRAVSGTIEANGEWIGTVVDAYNFDITGKVNLDGSIGAAPSYSNAFAPNAVPGQSGTTASVTPYGSQGFVTVTGLTGFDPTFQTTNSIGHGLHLTGATHPANNGYFTIVSVVSATSVIIYNASAVLEATGAISWTENILGEVKYTAASAFVQMGRCQATVFESNYSEGNGDAHFLVTQPLGYDVSANNIQIRNHTGSPINGPFIWVDCAGTGLLGSAKWNAVTGSSVLSNLLMLGNMIAGNGYKGASYIGGNLTRIGNSYGTYSLAQVVDAMPASTCGIVSDNGAVGSPYVNGTSQIPAANWDILIQDYATRGLRIADNQQLADYLAVWVNGTHTTDFERSIQSDGAGNKSGTNDSLRSATLAQSAALTSLGSSAIVPPHAVGYFEIFVQAHRDDDVANKHATWKYVGTIEQIGAGTLTIVDGPNLVYSHVGDPGAYTAPTVGVSGSQMTVSAQGNTNYATTWTSRFEITKSQRAR